MRTWEFSLTLDPESEQPLFLQLAGAVAEDIRRGRLRAGDSLPGSRELAKRLGVNRNTVVAGYAELVAEGLVVTRIGGGTFVVGAARAATQFRPRSTANDMPTYDLPESRCEMFAPTTIRAGELALIGVPDARLFPAAALARAFRRAIAMRSRSLLSRADPCGHVRLREQLAAQLSRSRRLATTADNLMVTRSIEQGIDLAARTLLRPGDVVAVEALGYPAAWNVLRLAGARLVPLPVDAGGLDVRALEALLTRERVKAVFLTPHHQFPTTVVMPPARRTRIAELSMRHRFAIIEDDYDHEFHYDGKPVLPIAAEKAGANVIYIGSLANLLAPGIAAGFVTAPAPAFRALAALRASSDARGDAAMDCAIAELFEDGELLRHMRRVRRAYAARRDALAAALVRHLGSAVDFKLAEGGLALWVRVDDAVDIREWTRACALEGVVFADSSRFDFEERTIGCLRLGFSYQNEGENEEAVRRMARALAALNVKRLAA